MKGIAAVVAVTGLLLLGVSTAAAMGVRGAAGGARGTAAVKGPETTAGPVAARSDDGAGTAEAQTPSPAASPRAEPTEGCQEDRSDGSEPAEAADETTEEAAEEANEVDVCTVGGDESGPERHQDANQQHRQDDGARPDGSGRD